jgi:competence protein ComEC
MENKFKFKIIPLIVAIMMFVSGCGINGNPASKETNNSALPSSSNSSTSQTANRYKEVFDTSKDAGNLVVRFLYTKTTSTDPETRSGDSTLIKTPDGKVMLVDGSMTDCGDQIIKYLKTMGIKKIDAIVASHPHIDHIGGLPAIIKEFEVGKVYRSELDYPTGPNGNFLQAVKDKVIETVILKDGMSFDFGDTKIQVLNPAPGFEYPKGFPSSSTQFINDQSLVLKMTYKDSSLLLPGDIYITGEKNLLDRHGNEIQADILKIPHHGYNTSSSPSFISAVKPQIAVAEFERLASLDIYNAYRRKDAKTYITEIDGNVKVVANGTKQYEVVTEKDRQGTLLK